MKPPDLVCDARARLGEGPAWDAESRTLLWVDILEGHLHRFDPSSGANWITSFEPPLACAVPARDGRLLLAGWHDLHLYEPVRASLEKVATVEADQPRNRFNDGKCDPTGRLLIGTMDLDEQRPSGALYALEPDGRLHTLLDGVTISNGLAWSPDGTVLYHIDTPTRQVRAFDYDLADGRIANPRPVVKVPPGLGWPDGMTSDASGNLWIALWGGAAVSLWDPITGRLLERAPLPAPQVTSCAFGGPDLRDLYITTARQGLTLEQLTEFPFSGGLFRLAGAATGRPTSSFGKKDG